MTRAERLEKCARYLRLRIPEPAPPKRKAQKSFATLAAGQHLELCEAMQLGATRLDPGLRFEVRGPSNLGVTLHLLPECVVTMPFADKEWKTRGQFKKVRRPTKKKLAQ